MDRNDYSVKNYSAQDKRLIELFNQEMNRINSLYLQAIHSNDITNAHKLLKQLNSIVKTLQAEYWERAEIRIPEEYLKWSKYINDLLWIDTSFSLWVSLSVQELEPLVAELGPFHIEAVNALVDSSKNYVRTSLDWVERQAITMVNELQQEQIREELARWVISGEWLHKMNARIERYFENNMINWFRDRAWRFWSMDRYVDMLTRTETAIANTQWIINRALEFGITKFKIQESPDCCEECAEMNWDIVDISLWAVELPPFHPNCRGTIIAVFDDEDEKALTEAESQITKIRW